MPDKPRNGRTTPKKPKGGDEQEPKLPRLSADILTTPYLPEQELEIPSLGGTVLLRAFNGRTAKKAREWSMPKDKDGNIIPGAEQDEDLYERALVLFGVVDPKLSEDDVEVIFSEQSQFVGRMIALSVMGLNAGGRAVNISKG